MSDYHSFLLTNSLCCAPFIYALSFVAQIIENHKRKSGKAISLGLLFLLLNGYFAYFFYVFYLPFPIFYRIAIVLQYIAVITVTLQRFYYEKNKEKKKHLLYLYGATLGFPFLLMVAGSHYDKHLIGSFAGWLAVLFFSFYQIPQLAKNYKSKSVKGLSFIFVSLMAVSASIEFTAAWLLKLPWQTLLCDAKMLLMFGIYCIQFSLYKK